MDKETLFGINNIITSEVEFVTFPWHTIRAHWSGITAVEKSVTPLQPQSIWKGLQNHS